MICISRRLSNSRHVLLMATNTDFKVEMEGLTGFIKFDPQGFRSYFHLSITELDTEGLSVVGTWNTNDGVNITRAQPETAMGYDSGLLNRTVTVVSKLVSCNRFSTSYHFKFHYQFKIEKSNLNFKFKHHFKYKSTSTVKCQYQI